MSDPRVGIGIIGVGGIGAMHARLLAAGVPGARLAALTDRDTDKARDLGDQLSAAVCADAEEMLDHPGVDAVVVATPTRTHGSLTVAAVKAGKHVLCEKPLTGTVAEADGVLKSVSTAAVNVQVGFQRRYDADWRRAVDLLRAGEIGRPRLYLSTLREPTALDAGPADDFLLHFCIHDLDAARWVMGEVDQITVIGQTLDDSPITEGPVENLVTTLRFANGAIGVLDTGANAAYGFESRAEIVGAGATLRVEAGADDRVRIVRDGAASLTYAQDSESRFAGAYVAQLADFCAGIRDGTLRGPSVADGRAALALVEAAQTSLREGRTVSLRG